MRYNKKEKDRNVWKIIYIISSVLLLIQAAYLMIVCRCFLDNGYKVSYITVWGYYIKSTFGMKAMLLNIFGFVYSSGLAILNKIRK